MPKRKLADTPITGALAERMTADGRRRISLNKHERKDLQNKELIETAAVLFLDLKTARTWGEIAEELGISTHKLKELTKTPEFNDVYNALFAELGHDPRYRASQAALSDMLPLAVQKLSDLISSASTPPGVRLRAIQQVISLNGIKEQAPRQSDREELAKFLIQANVTLDAAQIPIPVEYVEALEVDIQEKETVARLGAGTQEQEEGQDPQHS